MSDRISRRLPFLLILLILGPSIGYCQIDYDGDGLPEVVVTRVEADKQFRWFSQEDESDEVVDLGLFGQEGEETSVGFWREEGRPARVIVT